MTNYKKTLLLALLLAITAVTQAQVDSIDVSAIAKDDTAAFKMQDYNINADAIAIDDTAYEEEGYSATYRNPIYYFGNPFCAHFAECRFTIGEAFGLGVSYTYLPEVWGIHATVGTFLRIDHDLHCSNLMLSVGPDYRLSKPWSLYDFHFFGSIGIRCLDRDKTIPARPTLEVGAQMSHAGNPGGFCFNSGSLSLLTDFQHFYVTLGVSLSLSVIASSLVILAVANQ